MTEKALTADSFKAAYPDVYSSIWDEAVKAGVAEGNKTGMEAGLAQGKADGAKAERERIAGIKAAAGYSIANPTIAALVESLIVDGTQASDAAGKILAKINDDLAARNTTFKADDAGGKIPGASVPFEAEAEQKKGFMVLMEAYMAEKKCTKAAAIRAISASNPEAHEAWLASLKPQKSE